MYFLSSIFGDLDAVTYFFVNSGAFTLLVALLFLVLGLLIGFFTWARYKRRWRKSERAIEAMKDETALLKRRVSELATRPAPKAPNQARPEISPSSPLAALIKAATKTAARPALTPEPPPFTVPSAAFSIWTSTGWSASAVKPDPLPAGRGFSVWMEKAPAAPKAAKSHAFTLWTEKSWKPHPPKITAPAAATGFSLWTLPDFLPSANSSNVAGLAVPIFPTGRGFSIWTESDLTEMHSPAPSKAPREEPSTFVAAVASAVRTVAAPSKITTVATHSTENTLEAKPAPMIDDANGKGSIFARAVASAKTLPGSSAAPPPALEKAGNGPPNPSDIYRAELDSGIVRNDFLLGIVFKNVPAHPDELGEIRGIDTSVQSALQSFGVHTFKQIALWTHDQADEFTRRLGLNMPGVSARWIHEARELQWKMHGETV